MKKRPRMAHYLSPSHFIIKMRQFFVSLQAKDCFDWATKWTLFIDQSESVLSHFTRRHKTTTTILKCQNLSCTWSRYDQHTERTTMSTTAAATKGPSVRTLKGLKCALSNRERERERENEERVRARVGQWLWPSWQSSCFQHTSTWVRIQSLAIFLTFIYCQVFKRGKEKAWKIKTKSLIPL